MGELTLCGEDEFAELMRDMVDIEAPRLFAVVQVRGERIDCRIAAWGMAFADHAWVVGDCGTLLSARSPERVCHLMSRDPDVTAELVWVDGPTEG